MNVKKGLLALTLLAAFGSCKKNAVDYQKGGIDESKVYQKPITYDQIELVSNLEKITLILEDLYKEKKNLKLVNAAIYSRAYTDESVLLKDLIQPGVSILPANKKFVALCNKWNVNLQAFSDNFWVAAKEKNDTKLLAFLAVIQTIHLPVQNLNNNPFGADNQTNNQNNNSQVSIYFPYSSEYDYSASGESYGPVASLVAASAEADEALGFQPENINEKFNTVKKGTRKYWRTAQWLSTGFLWFSWLSHDMANIAVFLPRELPFDMLIGAIAVLIFWLGVIFYNHGGKIQNIVLYQKVLK